MLNLLQKEEKHKRIWTKLKEENKALKKENEALKNAIAMHLGQEIFKHECKDGVCHIDLGDTEDPRQDYEIEKEYNKEEHMNNSKKMIKENRL